MIALLSRARRKPKQVRKQGVPPRFSSDLGGSSKKSTGISTNNEYPQSCLPKDWSHLEPDAHGAELAREARVWKVYVNETDKWDKERVEGWDKSIDVLLVFVSRSTNISQLAMPLNYGIMLPIAMSGGIVLDNIWGMLKEDPADISAMALRAISQALVATPTNISIMDQPTLPPPEGSFVPPKVAIIINTLWYTSLSLSISTAVLAMLAKDWCYSFLAHRTGHPRDQAHRRQRKWKLIERWKMEELIILLPLLMLLSLLLFAMGLCIYVWDLNGTVAIPAMCIASTFLIFYIWSSIVASLVKDFPYTTIISRIVRFTYPWLSKDTQDKLKNFISGCALLVALGLWIIHFILVALLSNLVFLLPDLIHVLVRRLSQRFPTVFGRIDSSLHSFQKIRGDIFVMVLFAPVLLGLSAYSSVDRAIKKIVLTEDLITSLSLSWLIKHCETPSSIDIALQAISGASEAIPMEPLLANRAIEHIMQRIVSDAASDVGNPRSNRYFRGLENLRLDRSSNWGSKQDRIQGDIQVMVWDLKSKNEREIAELIKDGSFAPNDHNLQAMRIGNCAASQCLGLLPGGTRNARHTLFSIAKLLYLHFESADKELHPAALQSLANAAALHLALSTCPKPPRGLIHLFMRHCQRLVCEDNSPSGNLLVSALFMICMLLEGHNSITKPADISGTNTRPQARAWHSLRILIDIYVKGTNFQKDVLWIGCSEALSNFSDIGSNRRVNPPMPLKRWCSERASSYWSTWNPPGISDFSWNLFNNLTRLTQEDLFRRIISFYDFIEASRPHDSGPSYLPESIYAILTIFALRNSEATWEGQTSRLLLSKFSLPRLNEDFIACLLLPIGQRNQTLLFEMFLTYVDETRSEGQRDFATVQLWLICHLIGDFSSELQLELRTRLYDLLRDSFKYSEAECDNLKMAIETLIIEAYRKAHRSNDQVERHEVRIHPLSSWDNKNHRAWLYRPCVDTQESRRYSSWLNQPKNSHGMETRDQNTPRNNGRTYTARIISLILETGGPEDRADLLPLIADDFKGLPPCLQNFSPALAPMLTPLPPSRPASPLSARIQDTTKPCSTGAQNPGRGHVSLDLCDASTQNGDDPDFGIAALFCGSSEAF